MQESDGKDSLSKLIGAVERAAVARACACRYLGKQEDDKCDGCPGRGTRCYEFVFNDIARRLHALMPHDMDGREIKVGDTVKRVSSGLQIHVTDVMPLPVSINNDAMGRLTVGVPSLWRVVEPDSWERLEQDAAKPVCEYACAQKSIVDDARYSCINCPYDEPGPHTDKGCHERMRLDLVRRAKRLAGVEQ